MSFGAQLRYWAIWGGVGAISAHSSCARKGDGFENRRLLSAIPWLTNQRRHRRTKDLESSRSATDKTIETAALPRAIDVGSLPTVDVTTTSVAPSVAATDTPSTSDAGGVMSNNGTWEGSALQGPPRASTIDPRRWFITGAR
jgi:hypothetical protein